MNLGLLFAPAVAVLFGVVVGFGSEALYGWLTAAAVGVVITALAHASRRKALKVEAIVEDGVVLSGLSARAASKLLAARAPSSRGSFG